MTSLLGSEGGMIAASGVHELLIKIHDILENAVSKWACNISCIVAYLFKILLPGANMRFELLCFPLLCSSH